MAHSNRLRFPSLLAAWWLLLGGVNALWLARDRRPPSWDPCNHLVSSLRYRHAIEDFAAGRLAAGAAAARILRVDDHYPPLAPLAAAILSLPLRASPDASTLILGQLALAILLFAVYRLGSELADPETGVLAAVAAASFLVFASQSRMFMLDLPDAAMTSLALLALWRAGDFSCWRPALVFGAALGAALLTKWTCVFFLWLPVGRSHAVAARARWRNVARLFAALAAGAALALPWYAAHLWNIASDFGKFGYRVGEREGDPPVLSFRSLLYYAAQLPQVMGLPWFLLFLAGLAGFAIAWRRGALRASSGLFLALWAAGGWLVLTLLRNKDPRYLMPLLPALALLAAVGLRRLWSARRLLRFAAGAAALSTLALAWMADPPRQDEWPVPQAVAFLADVSAGNPAPRMRIVPDLPFFERHAFEYSAEELRFSLDVGTWFGFPRFTDFVIAKTGDQGDRPEPARIMEEALRPGSDFPLLFKPKWAKKLPDASVATIYAREITPVPGVSVEELVEDLRKAVAAEILSRAAEPRGLDVAIEPYSNEETLRGHLRKVTVRADSLSALPRRRAAGLAVEDVRVELGDLTVNPYAIVRDGTLQVLALRELVPHVRVRESAANSYLASLEGSPSLRFRGGLLEVSTHPRRGPAIELAIRPAVVHGDNIGFTVERCRLAGIPVPAWLIQLLASGNNPILKPMPCAVKLRSVHANGGVLSVN